MTETELAPWRTRLETERTQLLADLAEQEREVVESADPWDPQRGGVGNHFADDASDVEQQETAMSLRNNVQHLLTLVDHALARVNAGSYGLCERCGKPIPPARLDARPYATLCIEDQAREEQSR